ncbi:Myb domain containing protein [Gracilaria domingensis]|nr:Myb domain containing protein [Gracilaria domingensis]
MSEPFSHHAFPVFDFPSSPTVPQVYPQSCSGATHLEFAESAAEYAEERDESFMAPAVNFDTDYSIISPTLGLFNAPEQPATFEQQPTCFTSHPSYFAINKDRIKHELEMALRKPIPTTQSNTNSEHSCVSMEANSARTVSGLNTRVTKPKRSRSNKSKRARAPAKPWTEDEHQRFKESLELYGRNWEKCAKYIGTRRPQLVRSHAQKYLIKLWKLGLPLPNKVAESGRGYTLSGKPLHADSASAKSYLTRISGPAVPLNQNNEEHAER